MITDKTRFINNNLNLLVLLCCKIERISTLLSVLRNLDRDLKLLMMVEEGKEKLETSDINPLLQMEGR